MVRIILIVKCCTLILLMSAYSSSVHAGSSVEDTGLCPDRFFEGIVDTGSVDCFSSASTRRDRADAETDRIELEAICLGTPNATITSSQISATSSGSFFASVTCTVSRPVPPGTILCPTGSEEVFRAFDTLICTYFGSAVTSVPAGQAVLNQQASACSAATGRVLESDLSQESVLDISFFSTTLSCAIEIDDTDIIQCPFQFNQRSRDEDLLVCNVNDRDFETLAEAQEANQIAQAVCTTTTAGLGSVTDSLVEMSSTTLFVSEVTCSINIARYGPFTDQSIIRACDASCTTEVAQSRICLNGGQVGRTGCTAPATQNIERRCNTGPDPDGLCPFMVTPTANVIPLLLLDDDPAPAAAGATEE